MAPRAKPDAGAGFLLWRITARLRGQTPAKAFASGTRGCPESAGAGEVERHGWRHIMPATAAALNRVGMSN